MTRRAVKIIGMGHHHPGAPVHNDFFESLDIDSASDWIEARTGIRTRYSVLAPEDIRQLRHGQSSLAKLREEGRVATIADLAAPCGAKLRERVAQEDWDGIETVILGTSVPDFHIPANAAHIADRLGIAATTLDVNTACSSFVTDLAVARALLRDGQGSRAAVFNVERYTLTLDFADRRSCVLFGDGAACALLSAEPEAQGFEIVDVLSASDPSGHAHVQIPVDGYFSQDGTRVQKFAISRTVDGAEALLARNNLSVGDIDYFVGHQANLRMLTSACKRLGLPEEKHLFNVDTHGNQGAAGAPAVLSTHWERFKTGDQVVVSVVGSGLTWGAALLRYS